MFGQSRNTKVESSCEVGLYLRVVERVDLDEPRGPEDDEDEKDSHG